MKKYGIFILVFLLVFGSITRAGDAAFGQPFQDFKGVGCMIGHLLSETEQSLSSQFNLESQSDYLAEIQNFDASLESLAHSGTYDICDYFPLNQGDYWIYRNYYDPSQSFRMSIHGNVTWDSVYYDTVVLNVTG